MFNKLTIFALSAICCLATAPALAADTAPPPPSKCALTELASLPLTVTANGMISIPVKINGSEQQFVAAFGQPYSAVDPALSGEQQLILRPMGSSWHLAFFNYMGDTSDTIANIPKVSIGHADLSNIHVLLLHGPVAPGTSGVVGDDVLSNFDVELNLKAHTLNLFSPNHCPGNVVYWGRPYIALPMSFDTAGTPEFTMQLDGKDVTVEFAPINASAMIDGASARALFGITPPAPPAPVHERLMDMATQAPPHVNLGPAQMHTFGELNFQGVSIKNLNVVVAPDTGNPCQGNTQIHGEMATRCSGGHDLSLGRNELRNLRLYFSFKEKLLYITGADPDVPTQNAPAATAAIH